MGVATKTIREDVASRWQPIETAPRKGRVLILTWDDYRRESDLYWPLIGEFHDVDTDGRLVFSIDGPSQIPTHWMPLPNAPTKDA